MMLTYVEIFLSVSMGLVLGSFGNVLIHRLPLKQSVVRPSSHCPHCLKPIPWSENIPVLSYLLLKGRCSQCQAKISVSYPIVELVMGLLFLFFYYRSGWGLELFTRDWPFVFGLVTLTVIDLNHRIIPDEISIGGLVWGLISGYFWASSPFFDLLMGAVGGFLFFYIVALVYQKVSGREGLGGGDIKLIAMLGSFVGFQGVVMTILISSLLGVAAGILFGMFQRQKKLLQVAIPFGPFLAVAALIYYALFLNSDRGGDLWFPFMTAM